MTNPLGLPAEPADNQLAERQHRFLVRGAVSFVLAVILASMIAGMFSQRSDINALQTEIAATPTTGQVLGMQKEVDNLRAVINTQAQWIGSLQVRLLNLSARAATCRDLIQLQNVQLGNAPTSPGGANGVPWVPTHCVQGNGTAAAVTLTSASSLAQATPAQDEAALHALIWADDGANVYDGARNQIVRFMGDVTFDNGHNYGGLPCDHGAIVTNTPAEDNFATVPYAYGCDGLQAVQNWPDGSEYWYGGALATSSTIYDYGARVTVGSACPYGCIVGNYIARFNASTLALEGLTQVTGPTQFLSFSDAVPCYKGHCMIGTSQPGTCPFLVDCKSGVDVWVPTGDEANPSAWHIYNSVLPSSLDIGTVVSPFRYNSTWYAITKNFDGIGSYLEELTAGCMRGCTWHLTGRTWPTTGSVSYSAQVDAATGDVTYAENDPAFYGLHWLAIH